MAKVSIFWVRFLYVRLVNVILISMFSFLVALSQMGTQGSRGRVPSAFVVRFG